MFLLRALHAEPHSDGSAGFGDDVHPVAAVFNRK